ncbi:MAG: protease modulator HflK [Planctomycetota bacterium]|jgi:regulator of protease activity HflC (stomatin/prohibitin superfamily)/small neutral amino acid transporter SnatA (MarC family)
MNLSPRKAKTVSVIAFVLSLFFFIFTLVLGAFSATLSMYLLSWQILAGVLVWGVLIAQFYQRTLAEQEKLDAGQLSKAADEGTIFSGGADRMAMMAVAQKRLVFLEKWVVPVSAVLIGIYQVVMGLLLFQGKVLKDTPEWSNPKNLLLSAVLMATVSFIAFLFSRYTTGMSAETAWKPLRAGGSYLLATALLGFALAISLALAQFKHSQGLAVLGYVIPLLLMLLGVEVVLNAILDVYRPRVAGQYSRAAFDSRILGMFNEPGGILHTVSHTIDYQFGFQVSQTWFYKLLEKAIFPLILFALLILYLMSSFVVIGPGQAGVVERYGVPVRDLEPGLHLKCPWPIEIVYVHPVDQIQRFSIGYKEGEADKEKKAFLWGEKHYEEEYNLLVAVQTDSSSDDIGAAPVSIVQASVPVLFRISDVRKYIYNHRDSRELLEAICYRELTRYAASAKIETDDTASNGQKSLLGAGRIEAAEELKRRIQNAVNEADLGVEIVLLGLQGVHPPPEVAKEYEDVVASVQEKQAMVLNALAEKNRLLTELGGSIAEVDALYNLAVEFERSKELGDEQKTEQLKNELQVAFGRVKGRVFRTLREAESYAFERVNLARGEGLRFSGQLQAYHASPEIYKKLQRLMTLEETLGGVRKYVVVTDDEDAQVYIVDLQEKLKQSLYDMDMGLEEK